MPANDTYPQHVVTAVIVGHDGATWLPRVLDALLEQSRPVQRVVAVDTGSRDRSGALLSERLGHGVVFGMDRNTGYAAAVSRALLHKASSVAIPGPPGGPGGDRIEWIWLLHDDCEPAEDALEQLLRGAAENRSAAVLGPKVRDWADHDVILEAGVTIDTVGRRITGIEPREVDQGQHDGDRDVLAVSSAGMLVRRDVWDQVGGFDTGMALFMEDVDFCWRVRSAGHRVRVITDAVVYHAQAGARHRRPISVGRRPRLLERRSSLITLLGNLPGVAMLASMVGNLTVSALRTLFFLVAKRPKAALDETAAVASVLAHPVRLARARRLRAAGRRAAYARLRADLPRGRSVRRMAEFIAAATSSSAQQDTVGSHHATDDPTEDDSLLTDIGLAQRLLTSPGVLLFAGLLVVALVAERSLLGGPLGGGALVPARGGASSLWDQYLQAFHPTGVGSATITPPYVVVMAALATVLGGKLWLAVDVILLGCVPLAGLTAYLAVRRVTGVAVVRGWATLSYALLPVAMGAVAAARIGTAVVVVLLPLIGLLAGRTLTQPRRRARRAAWATALLIAIGAAFVPLLWVIGVLAAVGAAVAVRRARPGLLANLAIVALAPPALLFPWTAQIAAHPGAVLLEAGLHPRGLAAPDLPARSLLLLSPGGPGLPAYWVTGGLVLAALAALLVTRRRTLIMSGWGVALLGLLIAVAVSRVRVVPATGGPPVTPWPGVPLLVAAAGLVLAGCAAGDSLRWAAGPRHLPSPRAVVAVLIGLAACSAPVLSATYWLRTGVAGPVGPTGGQVVPEIVAVSSGTAGNGSQLRTLVLRESGGRVSYTLLRGADRSLADPDLVPSPAAQRALNAAVAVLVAPDGGEAVDQGQLLAQFDIGFVLMAAPVNPGLARLLDGVAGLHQVSTTASYELWRLDRQVSRIMVVERNGTVVPLSSGPVDVSGAAAPAAGGTLELAEPAGGWTATLDGHPLTAVRSPAGSWAQAFRLPAGGGTLDVSRDGRGRSLAIGLEALVLAIVAVLALPGIGAPAETDAARAANAAGAAERRPAGGRRAAGRGRTRGGGSRRAVTARSRPGRSRHAGPDRDAPPAALPRRPVARPKVDAMAGGRPAQPGLTARGPDDSLPAPVPEARLAARGWEEGPAAPVPMDGPPARGWEEGPAAPVPMDGPPACGWEEGPAAPVPMDGPAPRGPEQLPAILVPQAGPASGDEPEGYGGDEPEGYGGAARNDAPDRDGPALDGPGGGDRNGASAGYAGSDRNGGPDGYGWSAGYGTADDDAPSRTPAGGWPAEEQRSSWPTWDETSGWPARDRPSAWPADDQPAWAPDRDAPLDPLPLPGHTAGLRRPASQRPPRWPEPDYDTEPEHETGGDGW